MRIWIMAAVVSWTFAVNAQQWQEVEVTGLDIQDSSGYTLFKNLQGKPLTGGYNIYGDFGRLKVQLKSGLIDGVYWEFDELDRPLLQCNFSNGVYHGKQVTYYKHKSKMRESQEYCYGTRHGEFARYDSMGQVVHSWYYLNGLEIDSKAEYLERAKTATCTAIVEEEEPTGMYVPDDFFESLSAMEKLDTIWVKDEVTLMQKSIVFPQFLSCFIDTDLKITVLASNEWSLDAYIPLFKPEVNEFVVFCGINKAASIREVHFALGKDIRKAFVKEDCHAERMLGFLEYDVFGAAGFPTILAQHALEQAIENKDPLTRQ